MPTILITSMGGSGSLNLAETIVNGAYKGDVTIVGTHCNPFELAKATGKYRDLYLVPKAREVDDYVEAHLEIIERHKVDLLIANSDYEVASFTKHLSRVNCHHLIPPREIVDMVQDKFVFNAVLRKHGNPTIPNHDITTLASIPGAVAKLGPCEKFWIRRRVESEGAACLETADQAVKWVELWQELRCVDPSEFVVSPYLPGRDFCVSLLFQNGELVVGKHYERLAYALGVTSVCAPGSTPAVSRTTDERHPVDISIKAVRSAYAEFGGEPHGYFQLDMRSDEQGTAYVTEINIGRFPMTSPQIDRVGKYSLVDLYIQMILEPDKPLPRGVYDNAPGMYMMRALDIPVTFVSQAALEGLTKVGV